MNLTKNKKGGAQPGSGRPLGSLNKKTMEWEAFGKQFVEGNLDGVLMEMERLRQEDPALFMDVFFKGLEYFKPKLQRSELTGKDGESLSGLINVTNLPDDVDVAKKLLESL